MDTKSKKDASAGCMERIVRLAVFGLRSCLLLMVILASPVWIPLYLVIANLPEYCSDELSRWLPAWWVNAKKAWHGESLPNTPVHPPQVGRDASSDHDSHDETTYNETL